MGYKVLKKLKEASFSVIPLFILILLLEIFGIITLTIYENCLFIIAAVLLIIGIGFFNLGADLAMQPIGMQIGSHFVQIKKAKEVFIIVFILGFLVTVAEPDLQVLADQLDEVLPSFFGIDSDYILIFSIAFSVGIFLLIGVLKIILKIKLSTLLLYFYLLVFCLLCFLIEKNGTSFIGIVFDSSGVTTGALTVPFIMALGVGISHTIGGREYKENSFGLVALCSIGPLIAVIIIGLFINNTNLNDLVSNYNDNILLNYSIDLSFLNISYILVHNVATILIFSILLLIIFYFINKFLIKLPKNNLKVISLGMIYSFIGLVIFLTTAALILLPIGFLIGNQIALNRISMIIIAFLIGLLVILAEPAIHVLVKQVEEVTLGEIKKKSLLISLSIGVGIAIALSMIRIIFNFSILYYLIPGFLISFGLSLFVPSIYTAIAFDSGGVASGPLTSTFILPMAIGACYIINPNEVFSQAFGIIALVALTPIITIQILGFRSVAVNTVKTQQRFKQIRKASEDNILIDF